MSGRTSAEAVRNFMSPVQKAVSCVSSSVLRPSKGGYQQSNEPHLLTFPDDPLLLPGQDNFFLSVRHYYHVVRGEGVWGRWKVRTAGYYYELMTEAGDEVMSYHWHPETRSPVTSPHMHIGIGSGVDVKGFHKAHLPTPRTALEDVLRLLIEDFGVKPERDDWTTVLGQSKAIYETDRTW